MYPEPPPAWGLFISRKEKEEMIWKMLEKGRPVREICRAVHCSASTVTEVRRKYGLAVEKKGGGRTSLSERVALLERCVAELSECLEALEKRVEFLKRRGFSRLFRLFG